MLDFEKIKVDDKRAKEEDQSEAKPPIRKQNSEPKFSSLKDEIMKIPKVKQILQKDRLVYSQDIEKRM
jgi:hypothetical protein